MQDFPDYEPSLYQLVHERHQANVEKWGHQHPDILQPVLMEEIGEVSKAYLQASFGYEDKTKVDYLEEIIDAMAVLAEMYLAADEWDWAQ